jgi:hypothetical protein
MSLTDWAGYGLDGWGSIPDKGKCLIFFIASRTALEPTQPLIQWISAILSARVKRQVREADRSPPSSAKVAWSLIKHRDTFTFDLSPIASWGIFSHFCNTNKHFPPEMNGQKFYFAFYNSWNAPVAESHKKLASTLVASGKTIPVADNLSLR